MRRLIYGIAAIWFMAIQSVSYANETLDNFLIYTEENPPFNYSENGEIKGACVDVLLEIFAHLNIPKTNKDIILLPWARGYSETQSRQNSMLFATVRTPERENLFSWVGPISAGQVVLLARNQNTISLNSREDFSRYKYSVSQNSFEAQALLKAGVPRANILYEQSNDSALEMLTRGRVDIWARDNVVAGWTIRKKGYEASNYQIVHRFEPKPLYFAFHKGTDQTIINAMQSALNELKANGTLLIINQKYISGDFAAD